MNRNKRATRQYTLFFNRRAETNEEDMNIIHPLIHEPKKRATYEFNSFFNL